MTPTLDADGYLVGFECTDQIDVGRAKHAGKTWYPFRDLGDLRDDGGRHRYKWDFSLGELVDATKPFSEEEKDLAVEKAMTREYTQDQRRELLEAAEDARLEGADNTDPRIVAYQAMRARKKAIEATL